MADTTTNTQNTNVLTKEDVKAEIQADIKDVITQSMQVVKKYVDDNSIKNKVERDALKTEIENSLATKFDFENEKEKIDKASEVANTLLGLFDADNNGEIDPKEFLNKLNSIYAQLDTTNKLSGDLENLAKQLTDVKSYIDGKIGEAKGAIDTINSNVSKIDETLKSVNANIQANYFTKEDVKDMMSINKDDIISEVTNIFYPSTDNQGDGATL